jgi:hypothetical protein
MNETQLSWEERASELEVIDSVWTGIASEVTPRTVLADPCSSIILVKGGDDSEVILRGPETKPRGDILLPGYTWIGIRLKPGIHFKGFPAHQFTDKFHTLPADHSNYFEFDGIQLHFPDFENVEQLVEHMYDLGCLSGTVLEAQEFPKQGMSSKSYSRYVKRNTGLSPYKLRQLQRMAEALRLLRQGMSSAKVASELGFADQAHLTRAAKQFLGHTPKELAQWPRNS